jgi:membrane protease YdiL (CAAX protease family)
MPSPSPDPSADHPVTAARRTDDETAVHQIDRHETGDQETGDRRSAGLQRTPRRPGPRWLRLLALVGPILGLLVALLVPTALAAWLLPPDTGQASPAEVTVYVVVQSTIVALVATAVAALLLRVHGVGLRDAGLRWTRASAPSLLLGLGLAAVVVLAVGLPLTALGVLRPETVPALPGWALVVAGLAQAFLLQGFPEELLFRGYQMTALRARPIVAVLVSAGVFAVLHLVSNGGQQNPLERALYLVLPFGFAVAAGALIMVTGSLWAAVGVHGGLHVGTLVGVFLGLGNGPLLWVTAGVVYTVIGLLLMVVARRRGRLAGVWAGPPR